MDRTKTPPPPPDLENAIRIRNGRKKDAPCVPCGKKTLGLAGLAKGLIYGEALDEVKEARLQVCRSCELYNEIDGKPYCGIPRLSKVTKIFRDESKDGCGCELNFKTSRAAAKCPRDKWPAAVDVKEVDRRDAVLMRLDADGIGDLIVCACAIAGYRRKYPQEKVTWAVRPHLLAWAALFPVADEIIPVDIAKRITFKQAFLPNLVKQADEWKTASWHELTAKSFDFAVPEIPAVEIGKKALDWAEGVPGFEEAKTVILAPFATHANRTWPLHRWLELEHLLKRESFGVVVLDGPVGRMRTAPFRSVRHWGYEPQKVAAMVKRASLVVGNDSGLAHLAGVLGVKALALCGPTNGSAIFNLYPTVEIIQSTSVCSPCCWGGPFRKWCNYGCDAMWGIAPERVAHEAVSMSR